MPQEHSEVGSSLTASISRISGGKSEVLVDSLAIEEPLEIRLSFEREGTRLEQSISITMRTPGQDSELATGFLFTEGIITSKKEIESLSPCGPRVAPHNGQNIIKVRLRPGVPVDVDRLKRHFYTTSSCGICGKASLELLETSPLPKIPKRTPRLSPSLISELPNRLRDSQPIFSQTGGLHAAGVFHSEGELLCLREDVGRHNAVDKVVGNRMREHELPLSENLLVLSGRISFELMQKALMAGVPVVIAVGAPSSLAVDLARKFGITLIGFVREARFNVYHGEWRIYGD